MMVVLVKLDAAWCFLLQMCTEIKFDDDATVVVVVVAAATAIRVAQYYSELLVPCEFPYCAMISDVVVVGKPTLSVSAGTEELPVLADCAVPSRSAAGGHFRNTAFWTSFLSNGRTPSRTITSTRGEASLADDHPYRPVVVGVDSLLGLNTFHFYNAFLRSSSFSPL